MSIRRVRGHVSERKFFCGDLPVVLRFGDAGSRSLANTPVVFKQKAKPLEQNSHKSELIQENQDLVSIPPNLPTLTLEPSRVIRSQIRLIQENLRPSLSTYFQKFIDLPAKSINKKTLILDMDETLVHSFQSNQTKSGQFHFKVRPFAKDLLEYASKRYEVILFTASNKVYADKILDHLDPCRELISLRLYRESCVFTPAGFVKDLRILKNRSLKDLIIVDNCIVSFAFQMTNGIPILSWNGDMLDCELFKLIEVLKYLEKVNDVRVVIEKLFALN